MDLLGFFKERNDFLEIKYIFPSKSPGHTGSSGSGSAAAQRLAARVRPGGHWPPHAIPRWAVRLGPEWAGVWPGRRVAGRTGSARIGCDHSRVWSPVYRAVPCCIEGCPRCLTECS
jgi:hypothetical protein